ncbi:Spore coat protein S [Caloramator mitchellensis]|uniref:Spore coat protein S n=1 Tax=Caloramator mitchellensis TaxID=908809 RepID=A0A0R3JU64_CALMK|nr:CotS family spore coat protein [Caloramator mitchellensis]KRQ87032.1 Spore coat protein S [Caloramator mitchellensis]
MHKTRIIKKNTYLNEKEFTKISKILKNHYNLVPTEIEKVRSVYRITTDKGKYCLKEFKHNDKKAIIGFYLTKHLQENGFNGIAEYYKTKSDLECIKEHGRYYYLTSWIDGRECNFENFDELKSSLELLADFHQKAKGFYLSKVKINSNYNKWQKKLNLMIEDLKLFKKIILQKRVKTSFDIKYFDMVDYYLNIANKALEKFKSTAYTKVCDKAREQKFICHDSFYYQNLLIDKNDKLYLIDLDSIVYDIPIYDLAKFLRRTLNKSLFYWDFGITEKLIRFYEKNRHIEDEEYEIMLGFLMIPHRFWKIGRKRYFKHKEWSEEKYNKKLEKEIRLKDKREEFFDKFKNYFVEKKQDS